MAGAALQRTKEQEARTKKKYPCPWERYPTHNEDELVAEQARCTTMQARELGETDLDLFNEYLFLAAAKAEARPIAEDVARQKAEWDAKHKAAASPRTPDGRPR